MKVFGDLQCAQLEQIAAATTTPAARGRMYIDITNPTAATPMYYDGSTWKPFGQSAATASPSVGSNYSIAVSVAANALTIALKDKAGSDCTTSSPATFGFRSSTITSGVFVERQVTAALSTVISAGSTGGTKSGITYPMWVYVIDNAGTVELAWSLTLYDESALVSTTAEGGAGAADSNSVVYSTTARSNVAIRPIGSFNTSQATAGTWASSPTAVTSNNYGVLQANDYISLEATGSATTPTGSDTTVVWTTTTIDTHGAFNGTTWTCPKTDRYLLSAQLNINLASVSAGQVATVGIQVNGTTKSSQIVQAGGTSSLILAPTVTKVMTLTAGNAVTVVCSSNGTTPSINATAYYNNFSIVRVGR